MLSKPPVEVHFGQHPLPPTARVGRGRHSTTRDAMFTLLAQMEIGGATADVNRARTHVLRLVYLFRVEYGRERRYIVRPTGRPGWSRIWRIA